MLDASQYAAAAAKNKSKPATTATTAAALTPGAPGAATTGFKLLKPVAPEDSGDLKSLVVAWIAQNSTGGPTSDLVNDMSAEVARRLDSWQDIFLLLDGGLLKSKKTTELHVHLGQFYVAELTDDQAVAAHTQPMHVAVSAGKTNARRESPPRLAIKDVVFDNSAPWNRDQPLSGGCTIESLAGDLPAGEYAIRISATLGDNLFFGETSKVDVPHAAAPAAVNFTFPPLATQSDRSPTGPAVVFLDVVRITRNGARQVESLAEPTAFLVDIGGTR